MIPNTCAGCRYACYVYWYGGTSTERTEHCQPRCELKKRSITMADENCELKEVKE